MQGITRYIFTQITVVTVFAAVTLTFAVWLTQTLKFVDFIVNHGLPASLFLYFVALLLPSFLAIVLPIALFAAVIFTYSKLMGDSELTVLMSAGFSPIQLARPAILVAVMVMLVVYALNFYIIPIANNAFNELQFQIRNNYAAVFLQDGEFNSVSSDITVYVRAHSDDGELLGILVQDGRDPERPVTMMAERGALVHSDEGPRVVMWNGSRQETLRGSGQLNILNFESYTIALDDIHDPTKERSREPRERFIHELFNPGDSEYDIRFHDKFLAEAHQRITMPLYTLGFTLVGLIAILCGPFTRKSYAKRIALAVLVVATLQATSVALQDYVSRELDLIAAMYALRLSSVLVPLVFLLIDWRSLRARRPVSP